MRYQNLATVHSTHVLSQAEAIRNLLREDGIPCILGGILRARGPGVPILDIQVQVPTPFGSRARQLIESGNGTRQQSATPVASEQ